ncbi:aldolase [Cellulosimicrobium terreum]|nr:aldolase [Cellulosimicrobium terreum]
MERSARTAGRSLDDALDAELDRRLDAVDDLLESAYPGDDGSRQPVHTVYVPGDRYDRDLPRRWGDEARAAVSAAGGSGHLVRALGIDPGLGVAALVDAKLVAEPIEDLRIDFEDGYGNRGDDAEDAAALSAAGELVAAVAAGSGPAFVGIRIKSFERATRRRGVRTLDVFTTGLVTGLRELGGSSGSSVGVRDDLPAGYVVTLAKVSAVEQVEAMVTVCERLEAALGLPAGRVRFEIQVETPQAVLGPDGAATVARMVHAAGARAVGLHYGTYDYSASLGIAAELQSMEHPAADHAKAVMQLAAAGTGVRLSDGSTNVLPVGDNRAVGAAWVLHGRLVRRSLERGFYQGWDLHPAQLASRYAATYAFYRRAAPTTLRRLRDYVRVLDGVAAPGEVAVLDEPATAKALAWFLLRALDCGALNAAEVDGGGADGALLSRARLEALRDARPGS